MSSRLKLLLGACGIVAVAAVIGLTSNALHSDGLPLIRKPLSETRAEANREQLMAATHTDAADPKREALFTSLKDAKACFDNKSAVFLDARAVEDYRAEHIAGALWLGLESVEEDYDKVLGKTPKDRLLVTYCSDLQCASATKLADELVARGHTRVVIMLEGLPGWKGAGYPTVSGEEAGS